MGNGWRNNYARSMDVDDGSTPTGPTSSSYGTAESACSSGWGELKTTSYRGLASNATASYQNGTCQLTLSGSVVSKLTVRSSAAATGPSSSGVVHTITRSDGSAYVFEQNGSGWRERYGAPVTLEAVASGWRFTDTNGTQEIYNAAGHLVSITDRAGHTQTLSYDTAGHLTTVQDDNGRQLTFSYDSSGRIVSATNPNGGITRYGYDSSNRLVSVSYPDSTPNDTSDDPIRHFLYEDSRFPNALTGIIDEKGQRFASWNYDDQQRVITSEHAGGEGHVDFTYNADGSTTMRDAGGGIQTYQFSLINGSLKVTRVIHQ